MVASKVVGPEVNAEKTKYMLLSHCQVADKIKTVQIFGHNSSK
jgi:hypothetical protein